MNTPSNTDAESQIAALTKENADLKAKLRAIEDIINPKPKHSGAFTSTEGIRVGQNSPKIFDADRLPPPERLSPSDLGL